MKQNTNFTLAEIAGVPYLLPVGQAIADHKRGIKTNAAGVYLWKLLEEEHSLEEVLSLSASHYQVSTEELSIFQEDILQFLNHLLWLGILTDTKETCNHTTMHHIITESRFRATVSLPKNAETPSKEYLLSIGGLKLKLIAPTEAFPPEFADFIISNAAETPLQIHQTIVLHQSLPQQDVSGTTLLHNFELNIIEQEAAYLLHFPAAHNHLEIHLHKDGTTAHCYCLPPYNADFHYDFFHAVRLIYLYLAQMYDMAALHSASILYQGKLWLFSGHSGMGKSTHTSLWKEFYSTPIINGDLNLLALENGIPVVHGIPWCGTSGIYDTQTYPLGGIILLNQSPENTVEQLTPDRKRLLVFQRLISPSWTKQLLETNLEITDKLAECLFICKLHCTKEPEAVNKIKKELDNYLA